MSRIEQAWQSRGVMACLLWPVSVFYRILMAIRRKAYAIGLFAIHQNTLPVVVVGNLSVGGTGKTPLCAHLVAEFQRAGWQPGIVSRGYGGEQHVQPHLVLPDNSAAHVGDEPLMLFRQTGVPVCVCVHRASAVEYLKNHTQVDIVFADDGLQHLAMARCAEIVVIDGARGFGNSWLLPAGPLREPLARLKHADLIVVQAATALHSSVKEACSASSQEQLAINTFTLTVQEAIALNDGSRIPLDDFAGQTVVAMAGIGHPERFFSALRDYGLQVTGVQRSDHHVYSMADLDGFESAPVFVTSKDAVKLRALGPLPLDVYEVPTTLCASNTLSEKIVQLEQRLKSNRE